MKKRFILSVLLLLSILTHSQNSEQDCESARQKYLQQNPDVARAGMNAWTHYTTFGKNEGRKWPNCEEIKQNLSQCISGDCENGFGVYNYSNGDRYEGLFKNGKWNGKGKYYYKNGDIYEGKWLDGEAILDTRDEIKLDWIGGVRIETELKYDENGKIIWNYLKYGTLYQTLYQISITKNEVILSDDSINKGNKYNNLYKLTNDKLYTKKQNAKEWNWIETGSWNDEQGKGLKNYNLVDISNKSIPNKSKVDSKTSVAKKASKKSKKGSLPAGFYSWSTKEQSEWYNTDEGTAWLMNSQVMKDVAKEMTKKSNKCDWCNKKIIGKGVNYEVRDGACWISDIYINSFGFKVFCSREHAYKHCNSRN